MAKNFNIRQDENGYILMPSYGATKSPPGSQGLVDPWAESSVQLFPLGSKLAQGERIWRYCFNGTGALVVGSPVQQPAAADGEQDDDIVVAAVAVVGATTVSLKSTTSLDAAPNDVEDDFAEGYLIVNDEDGEGHIYKILKNEALVTAGDSIFTLYPQESLRVALTTASQVGIVRSPYYKVIATANVVTGMVVGVAQFAVTASRYFWCQSGGPASVIPQTAISLGTEVVVGTTAAKVNPASAATTELLLGYAMTPGVADTEAMIIFLMLDN